MMYAPPPSDTPTSALASSSEDSSPSTGGGSVPSNALPPPSRRPRGSRSPSPKRRAGSVSGAASVATAGGALNAAADQLPQGHGADLKALVRVITTGFRALDGKMDRLHAAVEHIFSLVTTYTGTACGLAERTQAAASSQSSTSSTPVDFGVEQSRALTVAAAATPDRLASNIAESPIEAGEPDDEDAEAVEVGGGGGGGTR